MKDSLTSKTGSASIKRVGHTASNSHGTNPDMKRRGTSEPRDLRFK